MKPTNSFLYRRDRANDSQGQAIVELVICLPFLLLVASAVFEIGVLMWQDVNMNAATSEVVRLAFRNDRTAAELERIFRETNSLDQSKASFDLTTQASNPDFAGLPSARFEITYTGNPVGFFSSMYPDRLRVRSIMRTAVNTPTASGTNALIPFVP